MYRGLGDPRQALDYCEQALPICREVGDRSAEATALNNIGAVYAGLGDPRQALDYYEQALPIRRQVGKAAREVATLNNIAANRYQAGDLRGAKDALVQALAVIRAIGDRHSEVWATHSIAVLLQQLDRVDEAVVCQRQAVDLAARTEHPALSQMQGFLTQLEQATQSEE